MRTLKLFIGIAGIIIGLLPTLMGMLCFISLNPKTDLVNFINQIPNGRVWIVGASLMGCGLLMSCYPMWRFMIDGHKGVKKQDKDLLRDDTKL